MTIPRTYLPVKRCIYCGSTSYSKTDPLAKLGDEHIIPLAFGGNLLLPEASCQKCEKITSALETHCIEQMIRDTREHLGLRARRHKRDRTKLPVSVERTTGWELAKVSLRDHPAALFMFSFHPPMLLFGGPDPEGSFGGEVVIKPLMDDFGARVNRLGGRVNLVRRSGFGAEIFGRMLAKIAHAFAVAEYGVDGFRPLLNDFILGKPSRHGAQFVGGEFTQEPNSSDRTELSVNLWSAFYNDYYVVRLRLFGDLGMPVYLIVVGEPLTPAP